MKANMRRVLTSFIYFFDAPPEGSALERRALLGGKGAGLAEMSSDMGLPVPYGFTIPITFNREISNGKWPQDFADEIRAGVLQIERRTGRRLGDPTNPLFLSVRSGAVESMPGMMDSILNIGATPVTIAGVAAAISRTFAEQIHVGFLRMFARCALEIPAEVLDPLAVSPPGVAIPALRAAVARVMPLEVLDDPWAQLHRSLHAVFGSWNSARARLYRERQGIRAIGTAATVQTMVFGNRDADSGTGVFFTRNPNTGEPAPYGDYLVSAQGEDVVAGTHATEPLASLRLRRPQIYDELISYGAALERRFRDMCDIEFTVEGGRLWLLQVRPAKRSAIATVQVALDFAAGGLLSAREVLGRIQADVIVAAQAALATITRSASVLGTGLAASPGVATGRAYFSADAAADAADRGEDVIFIAHSTSPSDLHGFEAAKGILTTTGGLVSHASLVAREWGIPAVVGASLIMLGDRSLELGATQIREGDVLTIDGTAGAVYVGQPASGTAADESPLTRLRAYCGEILREDVGNTPLLQLLERSRQKIAADTLP